MPFFGGEKGGGGRRIVSISLQQIHGLLLFTPLSDYVYNIKKISQLGCQIYFILILNWIDFKKMKDTEKDK